MGSACAVPSYSPSYSLPSTPKTQLAQVARPLSRISTLPRQTMDLEDAQYMLDWRIIFRDRFIDENWFGPRFSAHIVDNKRGNLQSITTLYASSNRIVCGDWTGAVAVFDPSTCKMLYSERVHSKTITDMVGLSEDCIVTCSADRKVAVISAAQSDYLLFRQMYAEHLRDVVCVGICGEVVISGSYDNTFKLWDLTVGGCLFTQRTVGAVRCVAINHEVAVAGCMPTNISAQSAVYILDLETCTLRHRVDAGTGYVSSLKFAGGFLLTCTKDSRLCVFDVTSGQVCDRARAQVIHAAALQVQDNLVFVPQSDGIDVFNISESGALELMHHLRCDSRLATCVSVRGNAVCCGTSDGTIRVYDLRTAEQRYYYRCGGDTVRNVRIQGMNVWATWNDKLYLYGPGTSRLSEHEREDGVFMQLSPPHSALMMRESWMSRSSLSL